ncbi:P-loop containing nucleoside triphosphate hydrolase protein [Schizopora paradoxa]|uniref:p-loop containing nucleoside triphosphate hydrolase protein n=1 Tax=Schizopora paradoxa TaxID=27342 RepID=A0A0H2RCB6_9AGAM|nr:P-loop containing nucleoside triphosphate hydrolase protein [Schizopora paradoxa]
MSTTATNKKRVILIGVGGATCSGKTTLAKHLKACIPESFIIHQDDFAPPQEKVPIHPEYGVQDWDDAPGAIDWPRLRGFLREVKEMGAIPESHKSHDHLNEQKDVPVDKEVFSKWKDQFEQIMKEGKERGEEITWGLVDGFLLYWDSEVVSTLDTRIFLRVPCETLKKRRHERHGYHTAVEGSLWRDPPQYFEQIVYPAYVRAHSHMLTDGDVENGKPNGVVENLLLVDCEAMSMDDVFGKSCEAIVSSLQIKSAEASGE